jgi:RNA polymerase sigma-70 factor (ECF subfamily)
LGFVDGHPAMLVYEAVAPDVVSYFVLLDWHDDAVLRIRDFLYAPYALEGAIVRSA